MNGYQMIPSSGSFISDLNKFFLLDCLQTGYAHAIEESLILDLRNS